MRRLGVKQTYLFRSWYVKSKNYKIELNAEQRKRYCCDILFAGHFEADSRLSYIEELKKNGYKVKIFGPGDQWNKQLKKSKFLKEFAPVNQIWDEEYNAAINGAKIALCFFSKINRDTYTRRCFEIPASGTLLLSEYSEDMATILPDGKSAVYFKSKDDLLNKVEMLLKDDQLRTKIAESGKYEVEAGRHEVTQRVSDLMDHLKKLMKTNQALL